MKRVYLLISIAAYLSLTGCSTVLIEKADTNNAPQGVRIYPPKTYFFVNTAKQTTNIYILPDYANAYDVKPLTFISKQDFSVELSDGMLNKFTANQDTTAFIELLKTAADIAKSAVPGAGGLTQNSIDGTFGLQDGIYILSEKGDLLKIK